MIMKNGRLDVKVSMLMGDAYFDSKLWWEESVPYYIKAGASREKLIACAEKAFAKGSIEVAIAAYKAAQEKIPEDKFLVYYKETLEKGYCSFADEALMAIGKRLTPADYTRACKTLMEKKAEAPFLLVETYEKSDKSITLAELLAFAYKSLQAKDSCARWVKDLFLFVGDENGIIACAQKYANNGELSDALELYKRVEKEIPKAEIIAAGKACLTKKEFEKMTEAFLVANDKIWLKRGGDACLKEGFIEYAVKLFDKGGFKKKLLACGKIYLKHFRFVDYAIELFEKIEMVPTKKFLARCATEMIENRCEEQAKKIFTLLVRSEVD